MSKWPCNWDEAKAGPVGPLPDPLRFENGRAVSSPADWPARRAELLALLAREEYGREPPPPEAFAAALLEEGPTCAGLGIRRQYRTWFRADKSGPAIDWALFFPNPLSGTKPRPDPARGGAPLCEAPGKAPVLLLLNYEGNHSLCDDPELLVPADAWFHNNRENARPDHKAKASERGLLHRSTERSILPLETILARGWAVLSACYAQIAPDPMLLIGEDLAQAWHGVFDLWPAFDPADPDRTGSLGAWAWSLSRGLDLVRRIPELDAARAVATGYSRLGKTALLAAARDERFAACAPVQTGAGGVPLLKHDLGENVFNIGNDWKHWFGGRFVSYQDDEAALPFDQHELLACVAPRPLLALGYNDPWFDPRGEWLSVRAAEPVWRALGAPGLPTAAEPADWSRAAVGPRLGYARRGGLHGFAAWDWLAILDFADAALRQPPRADGANNASTRIG